MAVENPFGTRLPLIGAPMAGGPTTPALVRAAHDAGGIGFLAAGYQTPESLAAQLTELDDIAFGVNLFRSGASGITAEDYRRYADELAPEAERLGVRLDRETIIDDDDHWADKISLLVRRPVPYVSVTFGLPPAEDVAALQRVGTSVLITVTTVEEARAAAAIGADILIAQGSAAGGHSATHDPRRPITDTPTADLTAAVIAATGLPTVATGGVDGPAAVRSLLDAGAVAVAIGTLLLRTDESGTAALHRRALADPAFTETVITHAFTGRPARALRNVFIDAHQSTAPYGYPALHHLTREFRKAAAAAGDPQTLHLWAGTGYRNAPTGPAAAVFQHLSAAPNR
ncbi:nitronate monooxygenase [Microlunatus soli]|uniref:Propionate 3-nitronate monooxygenase n=1 Tax=Microlunatus soli TaxID=630515 RepID=A0A1H1SGJ9_9ACTN|nr:nitronate monooxygenase [Microlunatus soli]SDS47125.1 NAD(P)H-dependent flavin oxidoreductase YrpB, nitropropane dioxygenase family [Microlunatus soli]